MGLRCCRASGGGLSSIGKARTAIGPFRNQLASAYSANNGRFETFFFNFYINIIIIVIGFSVGFVMKQIFLFNNKPFSISFLHVYKHL